MSVKGQLIDKMYESDTAVAQLFPHEIFIVAHNASKKTLISRDDFDGFT